MQLKAIIVDDEETSRKILANYLEKYCPDVNLVGEASNIDEAYQLINTTPLDLVFLDVEMPYGNAFDLLDRIVNRSFETVFVTAYNHYAIEALNSEASYYLLKPISIDELIKAVQHVEKIKKKENELQEQVLNPKLKNTKGKITIPIQDGFEVLNIADILYCKADDNYTEIYIKKKRKVVSKTLKYFEEALSQYSFARVHKSYLVNVNAIASYKKGKGGHVVLNNGKEIIVAASRKADLLSFFK